MRFSMLVLVFLRYKIAPIVFEVCTRDQAFFRCFHVFDIANTEIQT